MLSDKHFPYILLHLTVPVYVYFMLAHVPMAHLKNEFIIVLFLVCPFHCPHLYCCVGIPVQLNFVR